MGFHAVCIAIVLTACGIETIHTLIKEKEHQIAIVLTACGIETNVPLVIHHSLPDLIAIVLTACGIETLYPLGSVIKSLIIAIVLTACGIETGNSPYYKQYEHKLQ